MSGTPWGDVAIAACTVFVLAFALLSGTALNPLNRPGAAYLRTALGIRLVLSTVIAALAAAWIAWRS
jgi:hypothetical protein